MLTRSFFIPRTGLIPSDTNTTLQNEKTTILYYSWMVLNKSQGQSFKVSLFLPKLVFSHGWLYVALSRTNDKIT